MLDNLKIWHWLPTNQEALTLSAKAKACCKDGRPITLASSPLLDYAESDYAPVEEEALAVSWYQKQTRFFAVNCNIDHKPLAKILGDSRHDQIETPKLLLK